MKNGNNFQINKGKECIKEKYRFFNAVLSSILLALCRRPKFFETLFSVTAICSFQMRCSSINTPKYLIEVIRFISLSFTNNDGSLKEYYLFHELYGRMYT